MAQKTKPPSNRGQLNIALNRLVKEGVIESYDVQMSGDAATVAVLTESGADQAVVVQRVREALPPAFGGAQIRTASN